MQATERNICPYSIPPPEPVQINFSIQEVTSLKDTLVSRLRDISSAEQQLKSRMNREGDRNIWLEDEEFEIIATPMISRLSAAGKGVRHTLRRVLLMETIIQHETNSPTPLDLTSTEVIKILTLP